MATQVSVEHKGIGDDSLNHAFKRFLFWLGEEKTILQKLLQLQRLQLEVADDLPSVTSLMGHIETEMEYVRKHPAMRVSAQNNTRRPTMLQVMHTLNPCI
jgi:hypothetical protein